MGLTADPADDLDGDRPLDLASVMARFPGSQIETESGDAAPDADGPPIESEEGIA